jgi:hypothetical protein
MFMSIFVLGALGGPPISGAIKVASGGFEVAGYYAGILFFVPPWRALVKLNLCHRHEDHDGGCADVDNSAAGFASYDWEVLEQV